MMSSQASNAQLKPIKNIWDALIVRKIRNECRLFMTNDTTNINIFRQIIWYFRKFKPQNHKRSMFGFLLKENGQSVGFGLISLKEGKYFITGALRKAYRGQGLGKRLFLELIKTVPTKEVWLEVLDSNVVANKLYKSLGFTKVSHTQVNGRGVSVMKLLK